MALLHHVRDPRNLTVSPFMEGTPTKSPRKPTQDNMCVQRSLHAISARRRSNGGSERDTVFRSVADGTHCMKAFAPTTDALRTCASLLDATHAKNLGKVLDVGDNASTLDDLLELVLAPKDSLLPCVTNVVHSVSVTAERHGRRNHFLKHCQLTFTSLPNRALCDDNSSNSMCLSVLTSARNFAVHAQVQQ